MAYGYPGSGGLLDVAGKKAAANEDIVKDELPTLFDVEDLDQNIGVLVGEQHMPQVCELSSFKFSRRESFGETYGSCD